MIKYLYIWFIMESTFIKSINKKNKWVSSLKVDELDFIYKNVIQDFLQKNFNIIEKKYKGNAFCDGCGIPNLEDDFSIITHERKALGGCFYHQCDKHYVCQVCLADRRLSNC
jgi:hypothetical protein